METDRSLHQDADPGPRSTLDIRQLVEAHYSVVYGYAFRLAGSAADAEDLAQQTFLIAHQKLHQIRETDKADRWLLAVVRSCFMKSRRRKRPSPAANLELNVDEIPEAAAVDSIVDEERLQAAIDQLSDEFKIVVVMFYFEELSYKEIAAELGLPIGTVMSRLSRAKGRLRGALFNGGPGEAVPRGTTPLLFSAATKPAGPLGAKPPR